MYVLRIKYSRNQYFLVPKIIWKYVDHIYAIELEIKDTTYTDRSLASYLDLYLEIDSEGRLITKLYEKKMISNF